MPAQVQIFPCARPQYPALAARKEDNFFLRALRSIEYGRLTLITPENKILEFSGSQKGPTAHLLLHDWGVPDELLARGEIGFAEAYIDGRWETRNIPALLTFALANTLPFENFFYGKPWHALWVRLKNAFKVNSISGSRRNIMAHYDLGNDFYALWLDKSMTYSCALFAGNESLSLEDAQQAKYQRILQKISAKPSDRILEIGCGWGGFAIAAARAGLNVTALTISEKQGDYARRRIEDAGLSSRASVVLEDYRKVEGIFDHIVSIGMFEHVGENYWPVYFQTIKEHLKPGGTAMIQSITIDDNLFEKLHDKYGFIDEYIFPGGVLPSKSRFKAEAIRQGLACREIFTFGADYARTLEHWLERFEAQKENILKLGYDQKFLRLWRFYLASCIAAFKSHRTNVMQVELAHS